MLINKHSLNEVNIKLNQSKQAKLLYVSNLIHTYYLNPEVMIDLLNIYSLNDTYIDIYHILYSG